MTTSAEPVTGALVRWPSVPGSQFGLVVEGDSLLARVRFDGEDEPKAFDARAYAVERVNLSGMAKRVSTGSIGLIHAPATTMPPRWQVVFAGGLTTVAEADHAPA